MTCKRCLADPQPKNYGSPRRCAFDDAGNFTPENWSCATLDALNVYEDNTYGDDESMQRVYLGRDRWHAEHENGGWLVLTRYKSRGCCSSAILVGDFWPPKPFTLAIAESLAEQKRRDAASNRTSTKE